MISEGEDSQTSRGFAGEVGRVRVAEVKERRDEMPVKAGLPSRKCQTFAMCGTGSDSKADEHVSTSARGEVVV